MPASVAARITRIAISLRFATNNRLIGLRGCTIHFAAELIADSLIYLGIICLANRTVQRPPPKANRWFRRLGLLTSPWPRLQRKFDEIGVLAKKARDRFGIRLHDRRRDRLWPGRNVRSRLTQFSPAKCRMASASPGAPAAMTLPWIRPSSARKSLVQPPASRIRPMAARQSQAFK